REGLQGEPVRRPPSHGASAVSVVAPRLVQVMTSLAANGLQFTGDDRDAMNEGSRSTVKQRSSSGATAELGVGSAEPNQHRLVLCRCGREEGSQLFVVLADVLAIFFAVEPDLRINTRAIDRRLIPSGEQCGGVDRG